MLLCACSSQQGYARVGRAADEAGTGAAESAGDPHATPLQKDVALAWHFSPPRPGSLAGLVFASQSQRPPHGGAAAWLREAAATVPRVPPPIEEPGTV